MKLTDESPMPIGNKFKYHPMEHVPAWHLLWWKDLLTPKNNLTEKEEAVLDYIDENIDVLLLEAKDKTYENRDH